MPRNPFFYTTTSGPLTPFTGEGITFQGNTVSAVETNTVPEQAQYLIDECKRSVIVLDQELEDLNLSMIFSDAKYLGDGMMDVKCLFDRENPENFEKRFQIPADSMIGYVRAVDYRDRNFIEAGDIVVGLGTSSGYSITSYRALFIGEAVESERSSYDESYAGEVYYRSWGDTYITLKTKFSLEGYVGSVNEVNATCFIPTHNATAMYSDGNQAFGHIALVEPSEGLVPGIFYPVESIIFTPDEHQVLINVPGVENIPFDKENIKLIAKGELG